MVLPFIRRSLFGLWILTLVIGLGTSLWFSATNSKLEAQRDVSLRELETLRKKTIALEHELAMITRYDNLARIIKGAPSVLRLAPPRPDQLLSMHTWKLGSVGSGSGTYSDALVIR